MKKIFMIIFSLICVNAYAYHGRYETTSAYNIDTDGITYHITDYKDGTCIITELDGYNKGYQTISIDGIEIQNTSSFIWREKNSPNGYPWNSNSIVHYYPHTKVVTLLDKNKQHMSIYEE